MAKFLFFITGAFWLSIGIFVILYAGLWGIFPSTLAVMSLWLALES